MSLCNSIKPYISAVQTERSGAFLTSKTSRFRFHAFALLGFGIVLVTFGCAESKTRTFEQDEDGGREFDAGKASDSCTIDRGYQDDIGRGADVISGDLPTGWNDPQWQETVISMLPEDWQDMKEVPLSMTFVHSEWDESDAALDKWEELIGEMHLAVRNGKGYVSYVGYSGCGDPYEAYADRIGNTYRVLISHAFVGFNGCGSSLYTYHIALGASDMNTKIELYKQIELGGEIELLASAQAEDHTADCIGLTPCDAETPCEYENMPQSDVDTPFNMPPGRMNCTYLDACEGAVCAYTREACVMQCGSVECASLESYPLQLSCNE
jgi:hypothetical protein